MLCVILFTAVLLCFLYYKSYSFSQKVYTFGKTPSIVFIGLHLVWKVLTRKQGCIYPVYLGESPIPAGGVQRIKSSAEEFIIIKGLRMRMEQLQQFRQVCGHSKYEGDMPICFPDVFGMQCLLLLVCNPAFRLSPIGLIHIGQTITQHGDLKVLFEKDFSAECHLLEYRLVDRGVEADVEIRLLTNSNSCVWSGVATFLSRSQLAQQSGSVRLTSRQQTLDMEENSGEKVKIEASADTGLKYAKVSGDWNPHHLFSWSARLLGYRSPIAHGLWTLARSVSSIIDTAELSCQIKSVQATFKRPLFLPGKAVLQFQTKERTIHFQVQDISTRAPHLIGTLILAETKT